MFLVVRRRLVGRSDDRLGRADGGLELGELALGLIEPISERANESIELANEPVLKGELDLEVLEALGC